MADRIRFTSALRSVAMAALLLASASAATALRAEEAIAPALRTSLTPALDLAVGWRQPPLEARTRCWWWWLNGNVTAEAITRDLEAMKAKGLGGANIVDANGADQRNNRPVPHGPDFASQQWRRLFLHALREADRLGLELGFNIQSGWNLGGPQTPAEDAAKKLAFSSVDVEGPAAVEQSMPAPPVVGDYYRDVALLAIPLPDERAELTRIAGYEQKSYDKYPGAFTASDASHLLDVPPVAPGAPVVAASEVLDITARLDAQGRVAWDAPPGRWRLLRIGYTLAGSRISTHSEGWDGWAIDYLDPATFERYWRAVVEPMLDEAGPSVGRSLKFLHTDSWELGPVNWTPRFVEGFRARRGYDPTPYLPTLAGYVVGDSETSTRFLNDFRRTLGDLIADGKYATFAKFAHERGLGIHPESGGPHAAPIDALACLGHSDIPMGEFWARAGTHRVRDFERLFVKQAASAAHIYGRRIVLAESFTSIGPHWEEDPQSLKPEFDRVACEGLNLVMLHTFDCSPASMGVPGQAYFAGTHINPQVTWWRHADAFFGYLNRCQFLLQQGLPVADVLYFYGENVPSFVRLKRDDPAGVLPGYDYDVINLEALVERTEVVNGRIVLPDGTSYAMLALPGGNCYSLRALEQIARLADAGALVVGEKPTRPIGLSATPADEARFRELADRLWGASGDAPRAGVLATPPREALEVRGVTPDFTFQADGDAAEIDYFHRRTGAADVYFLANRSDEPAAFEASFRMSGRQPELWDPVTGATADAGAFTQGDGRTRLPLRLPSGGSLFVVFRRPISTDARGAASRNDLAWEPKAEIRGPWRVAFDPAWDGPAEVAFRTLSDWSEHADPGIRYYSGTARYRTTFEMPADLPSAAARRPMVLNLGRVENVAAVTLNGKPLGVAWTEPFQVAATEALRPGPNELEIEVTNLWPNRLIGDQQRPRSERLTSTNITKFRRDSPLLPSGLLGPVQVLEAQGDLPTRTAAAATPPGPQ